MVYLSAFLTTKRLGFFLDFDLNSNTSKEWQDLTHSPLGILPKKRVWKLCKLLVTDPYKKIKLTSKPFTGRALRGLLFQMQNTSFRRSGVRRKGFKSDTAVLTFFFRFPSSPILSFCLLCPIFFY